MAAKALPSADYLRSIFRYDPISGRLVWRRRPDARKSWNARFAGRVAGFISNGRRRVGVPGYGPCTACRIIWKMMHDEEPQVVDHIDGNPRNNRLGNLRAATYAQNARNTRTISRSGFKGVSFDRRSKRFRARIRVDGRLISLGLYKNPMDAHAAYVAAAETHFGPFARKC